MSAQIEQNLTEFCRGDYPFQFVYDGVDQKRFSSAWECGEDACRLDSLLSITAARRPRRARLTALTNSGLV
jgi:hypothetical protein